MPSVVEKALVGEVVKVCEIFLGIAVRKLAEEANLVLHFREDFRWLKRELIYVSGFLKYADQQSRQSEDVREWLEEIRVICLLAEDIAEECAVDSLYGNSWIQWIYRYQMGRRIKRIKDRIRSVIEEGSELKRLHDVCAANELASSSTSSQRLDRKRSSVLPSGSDSNTVGIDSKVDDLLRLLENSASPVIAVVGMGGMGKTHLLQLVYNHSNIRERYEKSIWLSVSQSYSVSQLQKDLVFQLDKDLHKEIKDSELSEQVLAQLIHERVQRKRCLVVLDDVWRAAREDDFLVRLGLSTAKSSPCKIVVTTRSKVVCANLNAQTYEMQCLSDEDCWRLFCVYAFDGPQMIKRGPEKRLEEVGRMIVKQCGNLPLAIKTIAASLAKTRMPRDWEFKLHQLQGVRAGTAMADTIMPILRLSYDSLPGILKACFAYLSFFPEDAKIHPEYLVNLWIGEGFIPAGEGQYNAAWDCFYQLANLCLLQLFEEEEDLKFILTKYCRVHDLLLDLAIQVSRENRSVFSIEEVSKHGNAGWCRILLGKKDINDKNISETSPVCLRTLSLSQNRGIRSIPSNLFTAMRGLRVLDLSKTSICALPESVGKMKLLKVLNLHGTNIEEVPECVRHLQSLLFLAMPLACERLPVWINEIKCLEHLQCRGVEGRIPKGISELVSLRALQTRFLDLSVEEDEFLKSEDLNKMSQLQELWLYVNHEMELERIRAWPVKMRRLFISNTSTCSTELIELPEKMAEMKDLEILLLLGFAVPDWICAFANLRELYLYECHCSNYPELQTLPNLVSLVLSGNKRCRELPRAFGNAGGFPQLRFLTIYGFTELEEFPELEEGAMECLEKFSGQIKRPKVKKVGERLEGLNKFEMVNISNSGITEVEDNFRVRLVASISKYYICFISGISGMLVLLIWVLLSGINRNKN